MNQTLEYIKKKFNFDSIMERRSPIEIPNFGRDQMAELFHELGFTIGAEVGVRDGTYSEILCKAIPGVKMHSIDPWRPYKGYRDYTNAGKFDAAYQIAKEKLSPFNCDLIQEFSLDAVNQFADRSLDFVYLDGNHNLQNVINDIVAWTPKIRIGGILAGHDYVRHKKPTLMHVVEGVHAYTDAYSICPWFVLGSTAVIEGQIRDQERSFMWVVEEPPAPRRNAQ